MNETGMYNTSVCYISVDGEPAGMNVTGVYRPFVWQFYVDRPAVMNVTVLLFIMTVTSVYRPSVCHFYVHIAAVMNVTGLVFGNSM